MSRVRVVLAEDSSIVAGQLRDLLAQSFEVVALVTDGRLVCDCVATLLPDVLVSDISLPGVDGLAAASCAVERHPGLRVVFVTVHADAELVVRARSLPKAAYVLKFEAGNDLIPAIQAVLAGEWFLSPSLESKLKRGTEDGISGGQ